MQIFIDRLVEGDNRLEFTPEELKTVLDGEFDLQSISPLTLEITRRGRFIYVTGSNQMKIEFDCDRCAETTTAEYTVVPEFVFHLGEYKVKNDEEDTTIVLTEEEKIIEFSEYYLEAALLAVPYIRHCSDDCKGLCPQCGTNLNQETCSCAANKPIDPRWQKLADLSDKIKNNDK